MKIIKKTADLVLEVSWEVCNKVGGIYTVVSSKAVQMLDNYKEDYIMIGPYFADKVAGNFQEELPNNNLKKIFDQLSKEGINCHYGTWLIKGEPKVILIDFMGFKHRINDIKGELWNNHKIDSLRTGYDYDEPLVWSRTVGILIEKITNTYQNKKIVSHFHEWLAGSALIYLKEKNVKTATVFTTHATILGRTLASANVDLYCTDPKTKKYILDLMDPNEQAYNYSIESKYHIESNSARLADCFTTVSEVTGTEARSLLKRKPDVLLPNGLDMDKFPTFEEISLEHTKNKAHVKDFLLYYFFPHYSFDLANTLFYFIAGRYEFRDKGIDIYIRALSDLNDRLKKNKSKKTIVAFIWVPAGIRGIKPHLLENKTLYEDIKSAFDEIKDDAEKNILYSLVSAQKITSETIFSKEFLFENKRKIDRIKKKGTPPLSTHDMIDPNDTILHNLVSEGLTNKKEDNVKVVFYPIYLTGADGLLDLTYYESMTASHLGIFPSYYEPWGYTPLEAGALGVSSVTTDLAGFGRFINQKKKKEENPGIFVLQRLNKSDDEIIKDLADFMYKFANFSKHDRVQNKMEAKRLANMADWKLLIQNYIKAHNFAINKVFGQ